jgi:hypothetical protein
VLTRRGALTLRAPEVDEKESWGFVTITHNDTQFVTVLAPLP